jgi:citrate lyase gamma subunit
MSSLKGIKLSKPEYDDKVPSTGKKVKLTPFRVGDEKTLLIAAQSESVKQMNIAMRSVIRNCVTGCDVDDLPQYDLEYLFLKLRAKSVGEFSTIGVSCSQCGTMNQIEVDLEKVEVEKSDKHTDIVKIEDNLAFKMKLPEADELDDADLNNPEHMMNLIAQSVEIVYAGEESITVDPTDRDDLKSLIESMTAKQFEKVQEFFETMPKLTKNIEFTCGSCATENKQKLQGLSSFF